MTRDELIICVDRSASAYQGRIYHIVYTDEDSPNRVEMDISFPNVLSAALFAHDTKRDIGGECLQYTPNRTYYRNMDEATMIRYITTISDE